MVPLIAAGIAAAGTIGGALLSKKSGPGIMSTPFEGHVFDAKSISIHPTILNLGLQSVNDPTPNQNIVEQGLPYVFATPEERTQKQTTNSLLWIGIAIIAGIVILERGWK